MNERYEAVQKTEKINHFDKYYWGYQYRLASEYLVPNLMKVGAFMEGYSVCEIGCGEGGVLAAFVEQGAKNALGTDIVNSRLEKGKIISEIINLPIEFIHHDIIYEEINPAWEKHFDLVLLRDVIEHLDDAAIALRNIKRLIKPGGHLFVTFPPYHSPYGGHQHTLKNFWGRMPYIHILPRKLFYKLIAGGRPNDIGEVKRLSNIRLTPTKFIKAALNENYKIVKEDYYFLRPVFKMKFGLPPIKISWLAKWKPIKNFFVLEAAYLLESKE